MDVDGRDLSNKVFVVTGAGNGIGRCVALDLVSRGATVAGVDINEIGLAETGHLTSDASRFRPYVLDIGDQQAVQGFPGRSARTSSTSTACSTSRASRRTRSRSRRSTTIASIC